MEKKTEAIEIKETFKHLINSCTEGITGEWVPDNDPDGFIAMKDGLLELAEKLGIKFENGELKEEEEFKEEEEEEE